MMAVARLGVARLPAGTALLWLTEGARRMRVQPFGWVGLSAASLLLLTGAGLLPGIGHWLVSLLSPFIMAVFMVAGDADRRGSPVGVLLLAEAFQKQVVGLAVLGAVYLAGNWLIEAWIQARTGIDMMVVLRQAQMPDADLNALQGQIETVLPSLLWALLLAMPFFMANWFAPALVRLDAYPPLRAMWWSLWACGVNALPMLLFFFLLSGLWLLAMLIPFGIGLLLFFPFALSAIYSGYLSIYHAASAQQGP